MPQSHAAVLIHLVFSTKSREPFIRPAVETELHPYMAATLRNFGCPSLALNGTANHVHILFRLSRTRTIADVVEEVKKASSKWIKSKDSAFANFHWQGGYGAFSIGESGVPALRRYIANQKEHHRTRTFQDELRLFFCKYGIEYDERYVWD